MSALALFVFALLLLTALAAGVIVAFCVYFFVLCARTGAGEGSAEEGDES